MNEHELIYNYRMVTERLQAVGYKVSAVKNAFYIHNSKGTIVADVKTIDGLLGFLQGVEWVESTIAGALA